MAGYTKLFGSILHSSVWSEDNETRIVWITMLAMADREGIVAAAVPGLARAANISLECTEKALRRFHEPDAYSRSPEFEGRRIETVKGGWRLLNHAAYREKLSIEERREYNRVKKQEERQRKSMTVNDERDKSAVSAHNRQQTTESEALAVEKPTACGQPETAPADPPPDDPVVICFSVVNNNGKPWGLRRSLFDTMQQGFPHLDVMAECKKAQVWCVMNEPKQKTPRGMPKFLNSWMSNAQNNQGKTNVSHRQAPARNSTAYHNPGYADEIREAIARNSKPATETLPLGDGSGPDEDFQPPF